MTTRTIKPDICVIGAGSGGLTVAAAAAAFGVSVVLVEKGRMGGDCLNTGCVPSKAMLAAAGHAADMRRAEAFGLASVEPDIDIKQVHRHIEEVKAAIAPNDSVERFTALGVRVIQAEGRFIDRRTVEAGEFRIRARRFVLATGSRPQAPPIPGLDTVDYLTNETVFERARRPARLIVLGGGPVGVELAQAFRRLGSKVWLLEAGTMLGQEDPELVAVIRESLERDGIEIREGAAVEGVEPHGRSGVRVHLAGGDHLDGSSLLVAAGRQPVVEGLDLAKGRVRMARGRIRVNARLRTTNRRVYAIGDAAGGAQFTHLASYHAGIVLRAILFRLRARADRTAIPRVTFTQPELAHVGLTEAEAQKRFGGIRVLRWPYAENDRAQAERRTEGLIKIVVDRRGTVLGASIAGAHAGELISTWTLAVVHGLRVHDLADVVIPYPTYAEIGKRAAISYFSETTRRPFLRRLIRFLRVFG